MSGRRKAESAAGTFIEPMKALGVEAIPADGAGEWHCEIKFDGYRAITVLNAGKARLWSRNHKPLGYPELIPFLEKLKCRNAVLDGEIVALDAQGRASFQMLQGRELGERPPIVYYLFDLLHLDGRGLLDEPIEARRALLEKLIKPQGKTVQLSPSFDVPPAELLAAAKKQGLEGIILKRNASVYESGRRSGSWLKVKNINEQEFVIGGFTPPKNSRAHFGALLVGYYKSGKLMYAGKVGTGFDDDLLTSLHARFMKLTTDRCPFDNLPIAHRSRFGQGMTPAVMRTVTWLKPQCVAQIRFSEWTRENSLRQPVFLGLRTDKPAKKVRREAIASKS